MSTMPIERPLVSVIIPTYRRPLEVRAAVASALAQTWTHIEVVVISDGPDTATRCALEGVDSRVLYVELDSNQGPAAARNVGVATSSGEWLTFLDDDDLLLPTKVEAQMRLADSARPERMVSCRAVYRHGSREDVWPERPMLPEEDVADYLLLRPSLLGRPGVIAIQSLLIHRSICEQAPFSSHKDHEDWAWLLQVWHERKVRVVFAWEPLLVYNIDTEGTSRSRRLNWADSVRWAEEHRRWISDRAFCSFLATKAALKAKRAGSAEGFRRIASLVLRNRPGLLELFFLAGMAILPRTVLHRAWKRSLRQEPSPLREEVAVN